MIGQVTRCGASRLGHGRVGLKEASEFRYRRNKQNENGDQDCELGECRSAVVPDEVSQSPKDCRFHVRPPLAIQDGRHNVCDVVVVRIEPDDAGDVVTDVLDLNVTAITSAYLRTHEESRKCSDMHGLISS